MAQKPTFDYDIIVIGSGAGGSPAATIASRSGKKVAVIERGDFGGEYPNWGEIPTGTLLHASAIYNTSKQATKFGLRTNTVGYNYPSMLSWRSNVIKRTGAAGNRRYYEKQGISVFNNSAHFLSPNEISVNRRRLSARKFLIATGAEWVTPEIPGLLDVKYHTPKTIFSLKRPPKSLFIIGSNSVSTEIAFIFSTLGTKVYLADRAIRVLPEYDSDVAETMSDHLNKQHGMTILPATKVLSIQKDGLYKRLTYMRGGIERTVKVDELLIANQQVANTDLGLENAGVKYNEHGIIVNQHLQTSARHIFATGACVHTTSSTHDILIQSRTAAHNLLRRSFIEVNKHLPLRITRVQPTIAQVGLSEDDCKRRDLRVNIGHAPITLTSRSNITDERLGFVKLIANRKGTLLGATIISPNASEMIHELALAIQHNLTARDIFETPHDFTSWSEAIRIAASKLL